MVYLILLACFAVPLGLGYWLGRSGTVWLAGALAAVCVLAALWAIWTGRQVSGWDSIGYGIFAIIMATPAGLGFLTGGAVGWWRWRRSDDG